MRELAPTTVLAIHALHLMLRRSRPVSLREIRDSGGFPSNRVRSVLGKLRRGGLIRSRSRRGYELTKAAGEISFEDVVWAIERPLPPAAPCGGDFEACATRGACVLAPLCRQAEQSFRETLRSFTLAELMDRPLELPNCAEPKGRKALRTPAGPN